MFATSESALDRRRQIDALLAVLDRVIPLGSSWRGVSPVELSLLQEVSAVTGRSLPEGTCDSSSAVLGFLVDARFLLERRERRLVNRLPTTAFSADAALAGMARAPIVTFERGTNIEPSASALATGPNGSPVVAQERNSRPPWRHSNAVAERAIAALRNAGDDAILMARRSPR